MIVRINAPRHAADAYYALHQQGESSWTREQAMVPENPGYKPQPADGFVVAIPVTGGMDSSTCWEMAQDAGLPAEAFYIDFGQPYKALELDAATEVIGKAPRIIEAPHIAAQWEHVMPGRNWAVIETIANELWAHNQWGELWFGNLAGETPAIGGDKSSRFFLTAQHLLTMTGLDVHLHSPLRGLDKTDLVRWWADRGRIKQFARTKSCFDPTMRACGRCQTCFRKMVAFTAAGQGDILRWGQPPDWSPYIAKYRPAMTEAVKHLDWSRYSPARCADTLAVIDTLEVH